MPKLEKRKSCSELITAYKEAGDPPDSHEGDAGDEWYKKFTGLDLPKGGDRATAWDAAIKNYEKALEFSGD